MLRYVSTRGGISPVDFETAVLQGFAADGGMFVPQRIPKVSTQQLHEWSESSFQELAFEILSLYIDRTVIPAEDLKKLIRSSMAPFTHPDIIPVIPMSSPANRFAMELFHGPTLSFKDVAMGFLINTLEYFLERKKQTVSLLIATTGDTGPAAAHASCGKKNIDCWVLFPRRFITEEQQRQMTTLQAPNVHAVCVENCPGGGDDLDVVIARLFKDKTLVKKRHLSSVNSINWCRVMFQSIHYFYGYFQVVDYIGEQIAYSVPTGAFGNLFAGYLAREMGLPIQSFICANNQNAAIYRVHKTCSLSRETLKQTASNAIDIAVPYNFWRFLYFASGCNGHTVQNWMERYQLEGTVQFDQMMMAKIKNGFLSASISDDQVFSTIRKTFKGPDQYLLDPHGAVAVAAADELCHKLGDGVKIISLLTAHPAKFPNITRQVLKCGSVLPSQCIHASIEAAKGLFQQVKLSDCSCLESALINDISS